MTVVLLIAWRRIASHPEQFLKTNIVRVRVRCAVVQAGAGGHAALAIPTTLPIVEAVQNKTTVSQVSFF